MGEILGFGLMVVGNGMVDEKGKKGEMKGSGREVWNGG